MTFRQGLYAQILGILLLGYIGIFYSFDAAVISFIIVGIVLRILAEFIKCVSCKRSFIYGKSNLKSYVNNKCKECQEKSSSD